MDRMVTVWEFRSVDGRQVVRRTDTARPDDLRLQHEYQRIVYRGPASGAPSVARVAPAPDAPAHA